LTGAYAGALCNAAALEHTYNLDSMAVPGTGAGQHGQEKTAGTVKAGATHSSSRVARQVGAARSVSFKPCH